MNQRSERIVFTMPSQKNRMLSKVKQIFRNLGRNLNPVQPLSDDLVEIVGNQADVVCIFCNVRKKIKVQCDTRRSNTQYWNYANLKKHIKNAHLRNMDQHMLEQKKMIESLPIICENTSEISTTAHADVYNRFVEQISSMVQSKMIHGETEKVMTFKRTATERYGTVKIIKMAEDGDCLYAACVHQLYNVKVGSNQHKALVRKLRDDVCEHIYENPEYFKNAIKLRINEENPHDSSAILDLKYTKFLENLAKQGFWGGSETLMAISCIYGANIVVFCENGPYYLATGYEQEKKRTLFLAYKNIGGILCHYDSISDISRIVLLNCAMDLHSKDIGSSDVIIVN